ncbi:hypothetical protein B0H13DRAFT_2318199 [Mycena leptocephala]|nr:hypothetical protein B0H13DRAFT_2318199 [Mycena leptocephala]
MPWPGPGSDSFIRTRMPGQLRCDTTILLNCVVCRVEPWKGHGRLGLGWWSAAVVDVRLAQFLSTTAGITCNKRDDADMYAGPEMRVVRSATPHPVFTSLISIPPSLSSPPSSTFADDTHSIPINTIAGLASSPTTPSWTRWGW